MVSAKVEVDVPPVALTGLGMPSALSWSQVSCCFWVLPADFSTADVTLGASPYSWVVPILIIVFTTVGAYVSPALHATAYRTLGVEWEYAIDSSMLPVSLRRSADSTLRGAACR